MILALDLGATTGYCMRYENEDGEIVVETGFKDFGKKAGETKYTKITKFKSWLQSVHDKHVLKKIFYERVDFSTNTYATQSYGAMKGVLHAFAENNDIPIEGFAVPTVKKMLTGMGNATKHAMVHYAQMYVDREINDDNEADSIGVMCAGLKGLSPYDESKQWY